MMLSDTVRVARRFQRSIRIDTDVGAPAALQGFICQGSARAALQTMARSIIDSRQRAFTWTGPYGTGKSSLALALAAAVGRNANLRSAARDLLGEVVEPLELAFPGADRGWLTVPVVGRRSDPVKDLEASLDAALGHRRRAGRDQKKDASGRALIKRLRELAGQHDVAGTLVIIDEMGKYLDAAANEGYDIHFFQELAEASGRSDGRLVIVGILHQSFDQYATRLGSETRDEWIKVQGRFIDIPIINAVDEVIDLLGRAIQTEQPHPESRRVAERISKSIRRRRAGSVNDLGRRLDAAWPLHPIVAALLGPVSRRRFGQNERSTFGFLTSSEPHGFLDFLRQTSTAEPRTYEPAQLWDYLRLNLEPVILASADGHRWAQGIEAVERCEARGTPLHLRLTKSIALIDLFRDGTGIVAEPEILHASVADIDPKEVERALEDLSEWSIGIFRKHIGAWSIYAGSDFDIEGAVVAAKGTSSELNLKRLAVLAGLQPVLAKQHYFRTGTLRWFHSELVSVSSLKDRMRDFIAPEGATGALFLAIPTADETRNRALAACRTAQSAKNQYPIAVGFPWNALTIRDLGAELIALETVRATRTELEGDSVARREVTARIGATSAQIEEELRSAFANAVWYVGGQSDHDSGPRALAQLVSRLADEALPQAPVIHSELVNRQYPSGKSQAAVRQLLHAMVSHASEAYLGIKGFPAERGLYSTILEVTGLHRRKRNRHAFGAPSGAGGASLMPMWRRAEELLVRTDLLSMEELYRVWSAPPFGVRRGVLPILALAFALAHQSAVAVYAHDTFRPELDTYVADLLLQDESLLALRRVNLEGGKQAIVEGMAHAIDSLAGTLTAREPLAVARALVRFAFELPPWSQRTSNLSEAAKQVRRVLLNAKDPHRALFIDLPLAFPRIDAPDLGLKLAEALAELAEAYPRMLEQLRQRTMDALGHRVTSGENLGRRARTVLGLTGDLRIDVFAGRLADFQGSLKEMEALASLALNKPPRDWSDRDPDQAALQLADLALHFRRAEALASVKDRSPTRHALAVVFGVGEASRTVMRSVDIGDAEQKAVTALAENVLAELGKAGVEPRLMMAALAVAGARAAEAEDAAQAKDVAWQRDMYWAYPADVTARR